MAGGAGIRDLRILLVGGKGHPVQLLRQVLGIAGVREFRHVEEREAAIDLLCSEPFDAVLCDDSIDGDGGLAFVHAARRTHGVIAPMMPIFLVAARPRRRDVEAARDRGFTDVIGRPVSPATVMRKLGDAVAHPRSFIAASDFFGPDRRSPARARAVPQDRRKLQPKKIAVPVDAGR